MSYEESKKHIWVAHAKHRFDSCRNLIGKPSSEILPQLLAEHQSLVKTVSEFQSVSNDVWYPGTAAVAGFIYGSLTSKFHFGDGNDWNFDGGWWGGIGGGTAGGGGPWAEGFVRPGEGEEMDFQVSIGAITAGEIQVFWWRRGGPIIGSFVGVAVGLGIGGGGGTGKWKRA